MMPNTRTTDRRELAHRMSDGIEVTLFWTKSTDTVTLHVHDSRSGEWHELEVDGHAALDAFKHPYMYVAKDGFLGARAAAARRQPQP
jgi:hypothetical protein